MSDSQGKLLHECLVLLLRPLVKFCLKRSLKIQDLLEASKVAFLKAAEAELQSEGTEVSMSRRSVMSGLHRRDVMRLWRDEAPPKDKGSLLTRVIGQWQSDKRFMTKQGRTRMLSVEGKDSEFVQLCASVSQDLNPYTVLFELERVGIVERSGDKLKLSERVYVPQGDVLAGIELLSRDLEDIVGGVEENVFEDPPVKNLHIKTDYDNVIVSALPKIREWFLHEGVAFHERARQFLSQFDKDINPSLKESEGGARVALGAFSRVIEKKKEEQS